MLIALAVIVLSAIFWYIAQKLQRGSNAPPGPIGLPVVGFLPFLGRKMHLKFTEMAKSYGDIFQIQVGNRQIVIVSGQKAIREALVNKTDFAARPDFETYKRGFGEFGQPGYTPRFKVFKKITSRAMAVFTQERKDELQMVAHKSVDMLMDQIKTYNGEPMNPKEVLNPVVWTIMGYLSYGRFFDLNDEAVKRTFKNVGEFGRMMAFGAATDYFPWLKSVFTSRQKAYIDLMENIETYSNRLAAENIKGFDPKARPRNMSDVYQLSYHELSDGEKKTMSITEESLQGVMTSIFGAGFGTIAATTTWECLYLLKNPEAQERCHQEIVRVIGKDRYPTFDDISSVPYCQATITECYRAASMSALGITHAAAKNVKLRGYDIKEGTPVIFNYYSAHYDPDTFPEPNRFKPDRFLRADGSFDGAKAELIMPFGLGTRRCGGEPIARLEVNLFFLTLLQRCRISEHLDHPVDPANCIMGLGVELLPFKAVFESRE